MSVSKSEVEVDEESSDSVPDSSEISGVVWTAVSKSSGPLSCRYCVMSVRLCRLTSVDCVTVDRLLGGLDFGSSAELVEELGRGVAQAVAKSIASKAAVAKTGLSPLVIGSKKSGKTDSANTWGLGASRCFFSVSAFPRPADDDADADLNKYL